MTDFILTGSFGPHGAGHIYCPAVQGLSASLADLAIVMPRVDNNRALCAGPAARTGSYAAVLTCDPFGSPLGLMNRLSKHGYAGIANWPSTILLEGQTKQWMANIPATPELEYEWLAEAQKQGLETLAFFRSLDQARAALRLGLRQLVLHPGLVLPGETGQNDLIAAAFRGLIDTLTRQEPGARILIYDHGGPRIRATARAVNAQGTVTFATSA
ncbi:MAG: phosphoenolpyruvate hydrolase family protein [Rhodobacteraceae bacterium]|nr:phosphoenolpyruvate hydrolase family protein [Paracoccaceae bacterium]